MSPEEVLDRLREYFQIKVNNLNADEMAEGPFEDDEEENFGDTWEEAAQIIDANGGLLIRFGFARPRAGDPE